MHLYHIFCCILKILIKARKCYVITKTRMIKFTDFEVIFADCQSFKVKHDRIKGSMPFHFCYNSSLETICPIYFYAPGGFKQSPSYYIYIFKKKNVKITQRHLLRCVNN